MRKFLKKATAVALSVALVSTLTACGGNKEAASNNEKKSEYVYVPEYKELNLENGVGNMVISESTVYFLGWDYDEKTGLSKTNLYHMNLEEDTPQQIPYEIGNDESVLGMQADTEGNIILAINRYINTVEEEQTGSVVQPRDNEESAEAVEVTENTETTYTDETEGTVTDEYLLVKIDKNAEEIFRKDITDVIVGDGMAYIQSMEVDNAGRIVVVSGDNDIYIFDSEANNEGKIENEEYIEGIGKNGNGEIIVTMWGTENLVAKKVDVEKGELGEELTNLPPTFGRYMIMPAESEKCVVSAENQLYMYDTQKNEYEEILDWLEVDIDPDKIVMVSVIDEDNLLALYRDYEDNDSKPQLITLKKTHRSEVTEKQELTYACIYLDSDIKSAIIKFNKNSDKYRIVTKEYYTEDYETGIAQFNSEVATGNNMDIIDFSDLNSENYGNKGILEDLYTYIEKDEDINLEDYYENIIKAYEVNGKLYSIPLSYSVNALVGRESVVGEGAAWSLDEFLEKGSSFGDDSQLLYATTNNYILFSVGSQIINEMVDWEKGECHFDSEEFIKLLEFAAKYPNEIDYSENMSSDFAMLRDGKIMANMATVSSVQDVQVYRQLLGEDVVYKGFPNSKNTKLTVCPTGRVLAIASKSENKEAAWEFIKSFLTEEYQAKEDLWDLPILKSAMDKKIEREMKPEYGTDENGNQVEVPKSTYEFEDLSMELYAAKEEDVKLFKSIIEQIDTVGGVNTKIQEIISEEATAFFSGQKTAKEVADVIQSRVTIYVNETK